MLQRAREIAGDLLTRCGLGMRGKLITLFVFIKVVPLVLLAFMAWQQFGRLAGDLSVRTEALADKALMGLSDAGEIAVSGAIRALDRLAQEDIERLTTNIANNVANFLYERDGDIRHAAMLPRQKKLYEGFVKAHTGLLVQPGPWVLAPDGNSWQPEESRAGVPGVASSNPENRHNFNYRPPAALRFESAPLFLEMTFVDTKGQEQLKVVTSDLMDPTLKDVSNRANTFVRAESYFDELKTMKPGEIYVSDVIGAYVPSKIIGIFTPSSAATAGIPYEPEKWAFAGRENPRGQRFRGIVRWATPVEENGTVVGYVTLALNHDHIMQFVDHITPTQERYTELPSAHEGNYAFIWDYKGRNIVHPRHHSIAGYNPESGEPEVPWLESSIYERWVQSGKPFADFIADEPTFVEQSIRKKPAVELTRQGLVGLDCRYLNFAPQCTGWFDLTSEGGSGSFNILWSGLRKLTTAATIPYYTGHYAQSSRGFGFVAVGAGLEDFHRPATEARQVINNLVHDTETELEAVVKGTEEVIMGRFTETTMRLIWATVVMVLLVILIAVWIASSFTERITAIIHGLSRFRRGERQFRFNATVKDEMGVLCDSFDAMAESIENSVPGLMVITDIHGSIIYANKAFLAVRGKTLEEVLGRRYLDISLFVDQNPLVCLLEGRPSVAEYLSPARAYYKGNAEPHRNEGGDTIGYIIMSTDVTPMVETQLDHEKRRLLLDSIFTSSPDIMWYKDMQGRYVAVNPRFLSISGKRPEEIVGAEAGDIMSESMLEHSVACDEVVLKSGELLRSEQKIVFADGHVEVVEAMRIPLYDDSGTMLGIMGVARDITERTRIDAALRKTQLELEQAVELATQASKAKSQFLANMSHEIRTPMNAILGFAYIALQQPLKDDQKSMFEKIHTAATGLLGVINDILDFSKIEAGRLELELRPFSLSQHVESIGDIIRIKNHNRPIDFQVCLSPALQAVDMLVGDSARLRQVLVNLLGNAVKFTEKGGVCFEVDLEDLSEPCVRLIFAVHDSGIGIEEQTLQSLFQPFVQADGSITRRFGGTGLGLVISKELVELMGGQLWVESEQGRGSSFYVSLPFRLAASTDTPQIEEDSACMDMDALRGRSVLLVEDNEINQMIAENILRQAEMEVVIASNGAEGVEQVASRDFDLVLMDIQMPVMDGLEAAQRIRSMPEVRADLPIIAMTAHAMSGDFAKSLDAGMNDHITKPIDPANLFATLNRWIKAR